MNPVSRKPASLCSSIPGLGGLRTLVGRRIYSLRTRGLSTEQIFSRIFITNQWGSRISRSGQGSDDLQTRVVAAELPRLLKDLDARSLLDVPCGDFHWLQRVDLGDVDYTGGDIVPAIIDANRQRHGGPRR